MQRSVQSFESATDPKRKWLMLLAQLTLVAVLAVANPAAADAAPTYDDGRIIAHDLDEVQWAWDLEFKFDNDGREHHGLLRTYSMYSDSEEIEYQTIKCEVVGDVTFSRGSSGNGEARFNGGYLACPMPDITLQHVVDADRPDLVTVAARLEKDGGGRQPIVFHPDIRFSILGSAHQTQFELWTSGTGTARSPLYPGSQRETVRTTIEDPDDDGFDVLHHLSGQAPTTPQSTGGPRVGVEATTLYIGYSPHSPNVRFTGVMEHLFVDPGKFTH